MVWTDLMETDFLHIDDFTNIGWVPQVYNVTKAAARGAYGKMAMLENVMANPLKNSWDWAGTAVNDSDAGLQLVVRSQLVDDMVPIGEVVAARTDMLYGSFRVAMKMAGVPGTCGAFFWVHALLPLDGWVTDRFGSSETTRRKLISSSYQNSSMLRLT